MKLARFWVREEGEAIGQHGERVRVRARGWSDESVDQARSVARDVARKIAERLASRGANIQRYPYGDRPLPEPVIRAFSNAAVTRNVYGAMVLNSSDLLFADIDREDNPPPPGSAIPSALMSLSAN